MFQLLFLIIFVWWTLGKRCLLWSGVKNCHNQWHLHWVQMILMLFRNWLKIVATIVRLAMWSLKQSHSQIIYTIFCFIYMPLDLYIISLDISTALNDDNYNTQVRLLLSFNSVIFLNLNTMFKKLTTVPICRVTTLIVKKVSILIIWK